MTITPEMLGRVLGVIVIALGTLLATYGVLVFITLEADPLKWLRGYRLLGVVVWVWLLLKIPRGKE